MSEWIGFVVAFAITVALCKWLQPVAHRINLVDQPGGRKKHEGNVPLVGGIAMYLGLLAGLSATDPALVLDLKGLLIGGGLLLVVGFIDDLKPLPTLPRFVAQILAAFCMIFLDDVILRDFGNLIGNGTLNLGVWSIPLTIFATVGVINATNMSDGLDGLAGGLTLIATLSLGCIALLQKAGFSVPVIGTFAATIFGFLLLNIRHPWRKRAAIFMGNSGSMFLGFAIAWLLIYFSQLNLDVRLMHPVAALWIFALPLLDTVCIMLRRIIKGRSPFAPDREHFHHILLVAGYGVSKSVWLMLFIAMALAGAGVVSVGLSTPQMLLFSGFLFLFALYFWGMSHAWRVMKAIRVK